MLRGFFDELTGRFPRFYGARIEAIENQAESEIDSLLNGLSPQQLENLLKTIRDRRGLVDTSAAYGNEVISTSKQILAFGGAGIGLAAAFAHNLADLPPLFLRLVGVAALFYVNLIGLSLFTIVQFVWVSRFRYPFLYLRKIGNTVPFFYYRAISPDVPRTTCQTATEKLLATELYAKDFVGFLRHLIPDVPGAPLASGATTAEVEARLQRQVVRDELQQYFLLISYQGYVNQYEVRMNNQFFYGLMASAISAIVLTGFIVASR